MGLPLSDPGTISDALDPTVPRMVANYFPPLDPWHLPRVPAYHFLQHHGLHEAEWDYTSSIRCVGTGEVGYTPVTALSAGH
jgi:hypothetical protein